MNKLCLLGLVFSSMLFGCDSSQGNSSQGNSATAAAADTGSVTVTAVSDYAFIFNDERGVNINFTSSDFEECTLTLAKSNLQQGFSTKTVSAEGGAIDLACSDSGSLFMQDDSEQTFAAISISQLDKKSAVFTIDGAMVAVRTKKRIALDGLKISVQGKSLKNLLK